ncbi:hypothetical protein RND81_12G078300 [Saponaria officinalis]|uniref:Uncharacterized protein n=1 Tax=Saponaria officinalis TaxID=3572 RepID=A0AAW1H7V4_SAPOF
MANIPAQIRDSRSKEKTRWPHNDNSRSKKKTRISGKTEHEDDGDDLAVNTSTNDRIRRTDASGESESDRTMINDDDYGQFEEVVWKKEKIREENSGGEQTIIIGDEDDDDDETIRREKGRKVEG